MHNPVGQEEKTGLARFPLAVLSNTLPSAKLAKGTGRDRTYPTHVNTHENRTPGTQQNYLTKPHNRTCPEHHKKLIGRGAPHGKGRDHPSRRAQPESGHFHTFSSFIISIGVRIFKAWCGRILLYVYTACLIRSSTWLKVSFPQSKSHPFLIVLFIRSANALCRGSPHCVMLMLICCAFNVSTYWFEQY